MTVTNVGTTGAVRPGKACMLNGAAGLVSVAALLAVLAWAVIRPRGWPEAVAAVPAAAAVVATGALPPGAALAEARRRASYRRPVGHTETWAGSSARVSWLDRAA